MGGRHSNDVLKQSARPKGLRAALFTCYHLDQGFLTRGEISPMGEILGIQGGNESV